MRINITSTLTPGTPLRVATLFGFSLTSPIICDRISVQMGKGGTGVGYILADIPVIATPDKTNAAHVVVELTAATAGAPGGQYSDTRDVADGSGIDITQFCVDGDHADPVRISVNRRV